MNNYLVEFRVRGHAKRYLKSLMYELDKRFKLKRAFSAGGVPHISLFGPFTTKNEYLLKKEFCNICRRYDTITFKFKGFGTFDNPSNKVIFMDVIPSEELRQFRYDLSKTLSRTCFSKSSFDKCPKEEFDFHATIVFKKIDEKFFQIWKCLQKKEVPHINQVLLRATIIRGNKILCEYDFLQNKLLNRRQSLNRKIFSKTIRLLKSKKRGLFIENDFTEKENLDKSETEYSFWDKISNKIIGLFGR